MARRVFLHIGPPKTGTSFLQAAWWQHRQEMAEQGVLYPGEHPLAHFRAAAVALEKTRITERMGPRALQSWDRLTGEVADWEGDAVISDEHYAAAPRPKIAAAMQRLHEVAQEVHLMVTVRDLARQVPAAWQQSVKQGNEETLEEYVQDLRDYPARGFWRLQDVPRVLDRWGEGLPAHRVHVVVHGGPDAPRDLLWTRTSSVIGLDPSVLQPVRRTNESLGVVQTELLRRVNAALPADRSRIDFGRLTKTYVTRRVLAGLGPGEGIALSRDIQSWLHDRGQEMALQLKERGYAVVGDLDDLVPDPVPSRGRPPAEVDQADLLAVSVAALGRMVEHEVDRRREVRRVTRANRRLRNELEELRRELAESRPRGWRDMLRRG
jgi:hypothetical protein